jgi:hypothetical protein
MKNILLLLVLSAMLSACGMFGSTRPVPERIVYVNKAVPFCPAPPRMEKFDYLVDTLTPEDVATPGKVAKSYVYDMTLLRTQVKIFNMILDQYDKQVQDFSAVQLEIDRLQPTPPN